MKKLAFTSLLMIIFACLGFGQQKGREVTINGEVIDIQCYVSGAMRKSTGAGHKECATDCAKGGIPLAILEDKTGMIFVAGQTKSAMRGANEMLLTFIAEKVKATGRIHEKGGVKLLLLSKVVAQSDK